MKFYRKITLAFALIALEFSADAQSIIKGTAQESDGTPVSFANILLLNETDSSLVKGDLSDENGRFNLQVKKPGRYFVRATYIGYGQSNSEIITITNRAQIIDLGTLTLNQAATELDGVVVEAKKPVFEQQIDRTVMNVASSISSSGSTALDVLEKAPGITVDRVNYSLSLAGKDGVRVMINGKMNRMPLAAAVQMLEGMNADNIEKIEIITTPPSKYEAEGDAGIINIVMKESTDIGTNGSFSVFSGYGAGEKNGGNINFNHRNKKVNFYGDYSFRRDHTIQVFENDRILFDESNVNITTITDSDRDAVTNVHSGRLGFDYQLSDKTSVGGIVSAFRRNWEMDAVNSIEITNDGVLDSRISMPNTEINEWKYYVANINFSHDFNDKHNISTELDYIDYDANNPTDYLQRFFDGQNTLINTERLRVAKETPINTWVPRIDYTFKASKDVTFEAGLKGAFNQLENNVLVENAQGETWVTDPELSQMAQLKENIGAAYSSISFKANEKLDIKAGLRYEYTRTVLDTDEAKNVIDRSFGNLFPSLFLNKKINKDNSWVFSYSRRISRPTFQDIAPFVIFLDPNTFWTGNEALLPGKTDAFRAEYKYKANLLSFQYSRTVDGIVGFQPRIDEENNRQLTSAENLDSRDGYSLTLTLPFSVTDWWDIQSNIIGNYQVVRTDHLETPVTVSNYSFSFNWSSSFKLPKQFSIEVSGFYFSPSFFGLSEFQSVSVVNFGIEKKLKEDRGTFRLSGQDIFDGRNFIGITRVPEENLDVRRTFILEDQIFTLTYTRTFGNKKLKSKKRQGGSSEEQQRL
ncbi:MAG: outer membrane beta-barrel family protein [Bacteroidota bacterium]